MNTNGCGPQTPPNKIKHNNELPVAYAAITMLKQGVHAEKMDNYGASLTGLGTKI